MKKNPNGRPRQEKAPKVKVLVSCFPEHVETIKEFVKKLNMKKLLIIFAIALASCTPDETKTECDCNAVTFVNNVPNGESYPYSEDCKDNNKVIFEFVEQGYVTKRIVKCK